MCFCKYVIDCQTRGCFFVVLWCEWVTSQQTYIKKHDIVVCSSNVLYTRCQYTRHRYKMSIRSFHSFIALFLCLGPGRPCVLREFQDSLQLLFLKKSPFLAAVTGIRCLTSSRFIRVGFIARMHIVFNIFASFVLCAFCSWSDLEEVTFLVIYFF